jgi:hypothetical protein
MATTDEVGFSRSVRMGVLNFLYHPTLIRGAVDQESITAITDTTRRTYSEGYALAHLHTIPPEDLETVVNGLLVRRAASILGPGGIAAPIRLIRSCVTMIPVTARLVTTRWHGRIRHTEDPSIEPGFLLREQVVDASSHDVHPSTEEGREE